MAKKLTEAEKNRRRKKRERARIKREKARKILREREKRKKAKARAKVKATKLLLVQKAKAKAKKAKFKAKLAKIPKSKTQLQLDKTFKKLRRMLREDILAKFANESPKTHAIYLKLDKKGKMDIFKELKSKYVMPNNQPYTKAYTSSLNHYKAGKLASLDKMIQNVTIEGATGYLIDAVKTAVEKHAPELVHKLELLDELSVAELQNIHDKLVNILNAYKNGDYGAIFDLVQELFESLEEMI
jgi:hypothetical protein